MTNREHLIRLIEDACRGCARYRAEDIADNLISEGVVKVVRCKDCKHRVTTEDGEYNPSDIVCDYFMTDGMDSNDYCSYGERSKTDE